MKGQKLILSSDKLVLIKLGGSILYNEASISALCQDIKAMMSHGFKMIIVHGGSKAINEALKVYDIESHFIQGLRKTTLKAMKVIEMVLCGQVNQSLVRTLNQIGVPAVGLSGATNQTLVCDYISEELGFVGEVKTVNTDYLQSLLNAKENFIPVVASLGVDGSGNALNINADLAASDLAQALGVQKLIYLTDQEGIYDGDGNLLDRLSEEHLGALVQKSIVKEGMLVKTKAILKSMKRGMNHILIANGHQKNILTHAILDEKNVGTLCVKLAQERKLFHGACLNNLNLKQPMNHSKTKHLLTGMELTAADILEILDLATAIKKNPDHYVQALQGKNLAMLFEKPSFRTRLSFHLAIESLGGRAIESVSNTRKAEEPKDLVRVLNGYCDFIMARTHDDNNLQEMATYSTIPIINGLSALYHPCQVLADLLSLQECFGSLHDLTLAYIGDGNNVLHTLLLIAPKVGIKINYCCPAGHEPDSSVLSNADPKMVRSYKNPEEAVQNVHAVYTDVWVSMGFEQKDCSANFQNFQVNEQLMSKARSEAVFMHCMPMERGKEVSVSLPDNPCSIIFLQSENRLHVQKALLLFLGD